MFFFPAVAVSYPYDTYVPRSLVVFLCFVQGKKKSGPSSAKPTAAALKAAKEAAEKDAKKKKKRDKKNFNQVRGVKTKDRRPPFIA